MSDRWERVEAAFAGARDLPPAARGAWLEAECAGDPALRAEVEALLAADAEAGAWFEALGEAARALSDEIPGTFPAGASVGPYEVLEEIGRGGMGVVYRARDRRLGRTVALKVLPPWTSADASARARLVEEARAASSLDHPNIGTLHDVVETADGALALVLAGYEGETLADRLARGPLDETALLEVARQAASGLAAAHARGVVHRDVKPANLFLTTNGVVKILDFGIAQTRDRAGAGGGTVAYMSPEQARGEAVDARTDLWSLGVVLHEARAGSRPFRGADADAVLRAIVEDDPPALDARDGPVAAGLARVVARLLAKDPAERFPDAPAVVAELDGLAAPAAPARRRPVGGATAALAGVAAIAAAIWLWPFGNAVTPAEGVAAERVAVLPFAVRGSDRAAWLEEGIVDLLSTSLDGAGAMRSVDPRAVLLRVGDAPGAEIDAEEGAEIAAALGAGRFVLGDVVEAGGRLRIRAALYEPARGAEPVARASVEGTAERLFNLVDELTAQLLLTEVEGPAGQLARLAALTTASLPALKAYLDGERAMRAGRFAEAVDAYGRAVAADSTFALAHYRLSKAASWDRRHGLARESAERAAAFGDRLAPAARLLVDANAASWRGDRAEAERLYRLALASSPDDVEAWHELGEILFHSNDMLGRSRLEARRPFERALALDPAHGESLVHLIEIAAWSGERATVDSLYRRLARNGEPELEWRALHAFVAGDRAAREAILAEMAATDARAAYAAFERVARLAPGDPDVARAARDLVRPDRPREWRAIGYWAIALLEMGAGDWTRAARALEASAALDRAWALEHRALWGSLPFAAVPRAELVRVRADLEAWDAGAEPPSAGRLAAVHDGLHPILRRYLLGHVAARLRDPAALAHASALEGEGVPAERRALARWLAASIRARVHLAEGRPREALAALGDDPPPVRADQTRSPILAGTLDRWLRAESLRALGREAEAAQWYASAGDHALYGVPYRAAVRARLASLGR